jgi:PAS domain S-box-containing protein
MQSTVIQNNHTFNTQAVDILESISDGFYALDKNWIFTYINKQAEPLINSKREFLIGKNIWNEFPEAGGTALYRQFHTAAETGKPVHFEEYYEPLEAWYEIRVYPSKSGLSVYFTNINDRVKKQQEKEELLKKLQESNALLDTLFDNAPLGLGIWDSHLRFMRVNNALAEINGLPPEVHIGKTVAELLPGVDKSVMKTFHHVLDTGEIVISREASGETPAEPGKKKYWSVSYYPIKLKGETFGVGGICEDITERKKVEQALLESEQQFRLIGESIPYGVWIADANGALQFVNQSYCDLLGETLENVKQFGWLDKVPEAQRHLLYEKWMHCVKTGNEWNYEYELKGTDGRLHTLLTHGRPLKDKEGRITKWVGLHLDITDRKKIEDELLKSNERLEMAQKAAKMGIFEWNIQENRNTFSKEYRELWGKDIVILKDFETSLHPDDRERVMDEIEKSFKKGAFFCDFRIIKPDGSNCWIHSRAKLFYDEQKQPLAMVGINMDITESKILEQKKDEFISIAGHELKTPLTTVKGYMQLIEKHVNKGEYNSIKKYLSIATRNIDKLNDLIYDLLDIGRIQSAKLIFDMADFDFDKLADDCINSMQAATDKHKIIRKGKTGRIVNGDRDRIEQVINNFLSNAIKYSPEEGDIEVTVSEENGKVRLSVKDNGIGIPEEHQDKVFDRFYRVDDNIHNFTGLGIGLYISQQIIRQHHGNVGVKSRPGEGSEFYFTIPIKNG